MPSSPYAGLPRAAFWKTAVAERLPTETGLYCKRFDITPQTRIATAGSCFAQHISEHLRHRAFNLIDVEPPPKGVSDDCARRFGYRLFSARTGNIYTLRQLLQLVQEALGRCRPADVVWRKGARYFDALRPGVEPEGLDSPEEVLEHRAAHLARVRRLLESVDLLVFTLGLTEAWRDRKSGTVYPTAPGTIAGSLDAEMHEFHNFDVTETVQDFAALRGLLKPLNPAMRFLLTVSPVPLTATATGCHVLQATIYSKSVLRAAAGQLCYTYEDVDYFPSYEIIGTPFLRQRFFADNLRSVSPEGVETVMRMFFAEHGAEVARPAEGPKAVAPSAADVVCEEVLLDSFSR